MKATYLLLLAGLASTPLLARAQVHSSEACLSMSGYVTDGSQPLAGVTVMVQGTSQLTITNSDGFFTMPLEGAGSVKLVFDAAGYVPQALTTTSCQPVQLAMCLLPGTRIRQRGRHKGFILKAGAQEVAAN